MMRRVVGLVAVLCVAAQSVIGAQALDREIGSLASTLGRRLSQQGFKSVAATDFKDLQGRPTELGRFLSDQLTVAIVSAGGVSMVDRTNIKSILAEHQLTEEGLVRPENAKKLGEFAGVDAILNGVVTALGDSIFLTVQATSTSSAGIVAAGKATFLKTADFQQLLNRSVGGQLSVGATPGQPSAGDGRAQYQDATAISSKDVGPLRVVLRSVVPTQTKNQNGQVVSALRVSFEFANLETQRSMALGLNAYAPVIYHTGIGDSLRASVVDQGGGAWYLPTSNAMGVGVVGVGWSSGNWAGTYNPSEILRVLMRQDAAGTNVANDPSYTINRVDYQFVFGDLTTIEPGKSLTVSALFIKNDSPRATVAPLRTVMINLEVVTAMQGPDGKKHYGLWNLSFDRVALFGN